MFNQQPTPLEGTDGKDKYYCKLFQYLHAERSESEKYRKEDEEFYFGDVEKTRSQFTKKQLNAIQTKYDIPISTKVNYAIIEQMISFLTGTQPYLRIIANEENDKNWAYIYEHLQQNVWTESDVSQGQFPQAIRDMLNVGSGFLIVRKNNFFQESTFGVVVDYLPWTDVFIDPHSRKPDFSDARCICVGERLQVINAERKYGVKISQADTEESFTDTYSPVDAERHAYPEWIPEVGPYQDQRWKEKKYIWCKEFYEQEEKFVFVSPEGFASLEAPSQTQIPNPERQALVEQFMMLQQQIQQQQEQLQQQHDEGESMMIEGGQGAEGGAMQHEAELGAGQIQEAVTQLQQLQAAIAQMPEMMPAWKMIIENGEEKIASEVSKIKQKRVIRTLQVGKKIMEVETLPTDSYPIHHFCMSHLRSPNKTYGVTHYIKDVIKGMNKFWGLMIYELQLNGHGKWIVPDSAVTDPKKFEKDASVPGAVLTYTADPSLPDGGKPEQVVPQPLHQGIVQLITMLTQLAEYITGIFGVMQGNSEAAPATMGATQSLQSFGTQRIKLQARTIENTLSNMSYSIVRYLQKYCPQETLSKTLESAFPDIQEALDSSELSRFKCRTSLAQNLPTSRQMASTMLSTLAGQLADPMAQQLLTQYAMKFLDIQEADEIYEQLNTLKQMEGQMQQQGEQIQNLTNQLKAAENNLAQKDVAMAADKAKAEISAEQRIAEAEIQGSADTVSAAAQQSLPDYL